jgi:hypothetical protein
MQCLLYATILVPYYFCSQCGQKVNLARTAKKPNKQYI